MCRPCGDLWLKDELGELKAPGAGAGAGKEEGAEVTEEGVTAITPDLRAVPDGGERGGEEDGGDAEARAGAGSGVAGSLRGEASEIAGLDKEQGQATVSVAAQGLSPLVGDPSSVSTNPLTKTEPDIAQAS